MANSDDLLIGGNQVHSEVKPVEGGFVSLDGEDFYVIRNYDSMKPFFMSLASDSNHWMFISSTGGLSAGRINPESALFPYYTDDKLQESHEITGSKTIFRISRNGKKYLWEPFSEKYYGIYKTRRNIYKNTCGNKLIFEEQNLDLGVTFRYGWMNSDRFGWIKKSTLINEKPDSLTAELLDGLQNILPYGVDRFMQNQFSTLLDGYKKSELVKDSSLGIFRLESIPVDRAEPSEALKATTVWTYGLNNAQFLLTSSQLAEFRRGDELTEEHYAKGVKGCFFVNANVKIDSHGNRTWYFSAEVNQDSVKLNNLIDYIAESDDIIKDIENSIDKGTSALKTIVADADGVQDSADRLVSARHFSNVLFNIMRGGIFNDGYLIDTNDFSEHLKTFNIPLRAKYNVFLVSLPGSIKYDDLEQQVLKQNDEDLYRLFLEYLPLTFSRRHGDPSRPWNLFSINIRDDEGKKLLYYQGNWRDIFQNWEALAISYPGYIHGMMAKFLNASSVDGYNPYRVTREGVDWEVPEPDNPFSNIGYWGDHQIIYLQKLMEISVSRFPGQLKNWLNKKMFSYANIPYRIKSYDEIVKNPHDSIVFDFNAHKAILEKVRIIGADAKLLSDSTGNIIKVSLSEKLLATLLSRLSNFIPEAGIWMNTLRPEWNDANNALVGNGVSMVTLYYMRRFISFVRSVISESGEQEFDLSTEIGEFLNSVRHTLMSYQELLKTGFNNKQRKEVTDRLGTSGSDFRSKVYKGLSGKQILVKKDLLVEFLNLSLAYIDQSIMANKRPDNLFDAYNLVTFSDSGIEIDKLYEMLEGQVSILSSGMLTPQEALEVLDSLRNSKMYRADQKSYLLYPDRQLPVFLDKNNIPEDDVMASPLLRQLIEKGEKSIIDRDNRKRFHFNGSFRNAGDLLKALKKLKESGSTTVSDEDIRYLLQLFEKVFNHRSFTGRSGTFYKYEGLGSIYWHMVSKLVVAIGENLEMALKSGVPGDIVNKLAHHYSEAKEGIGVHKSPDEYGAFPTDPYSHTPRMAGVQQPGMTGQVKEDIISRFFELGVSVQNGQINFKPELLRQEEFLPPGDRDASEYGYPALKFTYCNVPVLYLLDSKNGIDLKSSDGNVMHYPDYAIDKTNSMAVFRRDGHVKELTVHLNPGMLQKSGDRN